MKKYLDQTGLAEYTEQLTDKYKSVFATKLEVGSPLVASTAADMTDTDKIYVYVGSEDGYTSGDWYYYNGSAWTDGGVYNSTAFDTDPTLSIPDAAADAKATGDAVKSEHDLLIAEMLNANALDIIALYPKTNGTSQSVLFTWDATGTKCTVVGTPSGSTAASNTIFSRTNGMPFGIEAGKSYRFLFTSENLYLQLLIYKNGATSNPSYYSISKDVNYTIPAETTSMGIRLALSVGKTANETVQPRIIVGGTANAELFQLLSVSEKSALTKLTDMPTNRYSTFAGSALSTLISATGQDFPFTLASSITYIVTCREFATSYKWVEIRRRNGEYYIGTTAIAHPDYFEWTDFTYIRTDVMQDLTAYSITGYTSFLDIPANRHISLSKNNILTLAPDFPFSLESVTYSVFVNTYGDSNKYIDIMTMSGTHYRGNNTLAHPTTITWRDLSSTNSSVSALLPVLYGAEFTWQIGSYLQSTGEITVLSYAAVSDPVSVKEGDTIINNCADADVPIDSTPTPNYVYIGTYNGEDFVERILMSGTAAREYTIPSGITAVRFCYGHNSTYGITITKAIVNEYFSVQMSVTVEKAQSPIDPTSPLYVAFGASTTEGAVHHMDNAPITYSKYAYPIYVGNALGLRPVNLAVGGSGLCARVGNVDNNQMDRIYQNDDLLSRAKLVTITAGYGNDYSSRGLQLPIGEWDDYYPYDVEGYHPTNTGGADGAAAMKALGATWFGCLNWMIKWLGDHYPLAHIVLLAGRFSTNTTRTVTLVPQTVPVGEVGIPYKLSVANISTANQQINTALHTLTEKLGIPLINLNEEQPWTYYSSTARDSYGYYELFSTTGDSSADPSTWQMNVHPNNDGYLQMSRYLLGRIGAYFNR